MTKGLLTELKNVLQTENETDTNLQGLPTEQSLPFTSKETLGALMEDDVIGLPGAEDEEQEDDPEYQEAIAILCDPEGLTLERIDAIMWQVHNHKRKIETLKAQHAKAVRREEAEIAKKMRWYGPHIFRKLEALLTADNHGKKKPVLSRIFEWGDFKYSRRGGRPFIANESVLMDWIVNCEKEDEFMVLDKTEILKQSKNQSIPGVEVAPVVKVPVVSLGVGLGVVELASTTFVPKEEAENE